MRDKARALVVDFAVRQPFIIGGLSVKPGERRLVDLPISKLSNHAPVTLPVHVLHGLEPGPTMFVSAAIHGDELNGVEIIRRLLRTLRPQSIHGTLLCVPVVNVFGFISRSRYLPDRRDLNRSFPGSATGSLAARLAHLFLTEIVKRSQIGIDLHTAAIHRINLPQIRGVFRKRPRFQELGLAFGAEVMLESPERPGSLREAARAAGVDVLSYEGGEGLRFDEFAIRAGVDGITGVMLEVGMLALADGVELSRGRAARAGAGQCLELGARAGGRRVPHDEAHRRGGQRRRGGRPRGEPLRGQRGGGALRRAAASSSGARRCPSSTWATRC